MDGLRMMDDFNRENGSAVSEEKTKLLAKIWDEKAVLDISGEEFARNIESAEKYYESIGSGDMAMAYCNQMRLEGKAAEYVRTEFGKLDSNDWTEIEKNL